MNPIKHIDYLIVGQGIAGTLVAHFLQKSQKSIVVFDKGHQGTSTNTAAGLINPITGRRFVKSWKIDELLPFALKTYREFEELFGQKLVTPLSILRSLASVKEENDWLLRTEDPRYQAYLKDDSDLGDYTGKIHASKGYGEVVGGFQVDIGYLITLYREKLMRCGALIEANFAHHEITFEPYFAYRNFSPKGILFCEGADGRQNPYFNYLPYHGDKGEVLLVKIPNAHFSKALKQKIFIIPLGENDLYWIGATYQKKANDSSPTSEGKAFLVDRLNQLLKVPYTILEHKAAIRPTVKDRRPFIGQHPKLEGLYLFNGLGTKGTSLGPYWANKFVHFLLRDEEVEKSVNIKRFESDFPLES